MRGRELALIAAIVTMGRSAADAAQVQAQPFKVGDVYYAKSVEKLRGYVETADIRDVKRARKRFDYASDRTTEYHERILPVVKGSDDLPDRTFRILDRLDSKRVFDKESGVNYPFRDAVKRLVIHRGESEAKPYSPDGPLKVEEIHPLTTLVFVPALNGLLPDGTLAVGAKWRANERCLAQLAGLQKLEKGKLECEVRKLDFLHKDSGRKLVQIYFEGAIGGLTEDLGRVRDDVSGSLYLDAELGKIHSLIVEGERTIFDENDKVAGSLKLQYSLGVRMRPHDERFGDEAVKDIPNEPAAKDTAVLYEAPQCAATLVHPRGWALETVNGSTLLFKRVGKAHEMQINFHKDDDTPAIAEYAKNAEAGLKKQGFKNIEIVKAPDERAQPAGGDKEALRIGAFTLSAANDGPWLMRYYALQRGKRGATIGCFVQTQQSGAEDAIAEASDVLRSIKFTHPSNPLFMKPPAEKK